MSTGTNKGQFDNRLDRAKTIAKKRWGNGWDMLSADMQEAFVCRALVGELAQIDFRDAFGDRLGEEGMAERLLEKLEDVGAVCLKALEQK